VRTLIDAGRGPLSFPTYAGILGRVPYRAAQQLHLEVSWQAHQVETERHPMRANRRLFCLNSRIC